MGCTGPSRDYLHAASQGCAVARKGGLPEARQSPQVCLLMRDEIPLGGNGKRPLQGEQQKGTKVQTICGEREQEGQCDGRGLRLQNQNHNHAGGRSWETSGASWDLIFCRCSGARKGFGAWGAVMGACVRRTGLEACEDANQASNRPGRLLERME